MTQQISNYFAISLDKISSRKILSYYYVENKSQELFLRQSEWLSCLTQNPKITFELRYICIPSQEHYQKGKIKIVLLGKIVNSSPQEVNSIARDIYNLCRTFFGDIFEFTFIESKETIQKYLNPFEINAIGEVFRRTENIKLDSFQSAETKQLGFINRTVEQNIPLKINEIFHIYPFIFNPNAWENLDVTKLRLKRRLTIACF